MEQWVSFFMIEKGMNERRTGDVSHGGRKACWAYGPGFIRR